jgi:hypothetical protein
MRKAVPLVAAVAALVAVAVTPTQQATAFSLNVHGAVTDQALPFLTDAVLADIRDEHLYVDTRHQFDQEYHYDACQFSGGTNFINSQYTKTGESSEKGVVAEFDPAGPGVFGATDEFGQLLHPAQDFYAHSNWVEAGRRDLLDSGLSTWAPMTPWAQVRPGLVVAEGRQLPAGWTASPTPHVLTPTVRMPSGQTATGLISGTVPWDSGKCHEPIARGHWDTPGLHKDDPDRPYFAEANDLGLRQTRHEWCRMLHLTRQRWGLAGTNVPMALWVKRDGDPHPPGTACARPTVKGENNVTITMRKVKVRDDNDPLADGEINLNLAAYSWDFKNSVRKSFGPMSLGSGDSVPASTLANMKVTLSCVPNSQVIAATMQGWDDDAGADGKLEDVPGDPDDVLKGVNASALVGETKTVNQVSAHLDTTFDVTTTRSPDSDGDGVTDCRE